MLANGEPGGEDGQMSAALGDLEPVPSPAPECWCCGAAVEEAALTRLGTHPEVGLCADCARWVHRRARAAAERGRRTPGTVVRRSVEGSRDWVMAMGAHGWPVLGPLLRRLDRFLP